MRKNFLPENAVFFITGCSSGFGKELSVEVLKRGYNLAATARRPETLEYLSGENCLCLPCDTTDAASVQNAVSKTVERFGHIDVLINNAGVHYGADIMQMEYDRLAALFATNVTGTLSVTRAVLPHMPSGGASTIVNISSASALSGFDGNLFYSMSKGAVDVLSSVLKHSKKYDVRAMSVNPGLFKTNIMQNSLENQNGKEVDLERLNPGDPRQAAVDIVDAIEKRVLPLRLVLGVNALERCAAVIRELRSDFKRSAELASNGGYRPRFVKRLISFFYARKCGKHTRVLCFKFKAKRLIFFCAPLLF